MTPCTECAPWADRPCPRCGDRALRFPAGDPLDSWWTWRLEPRPHLRVDHTPTRVTLICGACDVEAVGTCPRHASWTWADLAEVI